VSKRSTLGEGRKVQSPLSRCDLNSPSKHAYDADAVYQCVPILHSFTHVLSDFKSFQRSLTSCRMCVSSHKDTRRYTRTRTDAGWPSRGLNDRPSRWECRGAGTALAVIDAHSGHVRSSDPVASIVTRHRSSHHYQRHVIFTR